MKPPEIESFHHAATGTWTHVVSDPATGAAAVVDPVLDYDAAAGRTATTAVDALVERVACASNGSSRRMRTPTT